MDELKYLTEYYKNYDEERRLISKHSQVEFLTTKKYINKFLKKEYENVRWQAPHIIYRTILMKKIEWGWN